MVWHMISNVAQNAGFRGMALVMAANLSMAHGPWQGAAWFKQVVEGAMEYLRVATNGDPLLRDSRPISRGNCMGTALECRVGRSNIP